VLEAKGFEEIHVDDRGAGGDDRVDHPELHHVAVDVHAAARRGGAGEDQPGRAFLVFERHVEDVGGARGVARREDILRIASMIGRASNGDVDVLDGVGEQLGLRSLSGFPDGLSARRQITASPGRSDR
jgi:hypothetical protein